MKNLKYIRNGTVFTSMNRYTKSIRELNRVLSNFGKKQGWHLSLADIKHSRLSPLHSQDLLYHSAHPEDNPFFPYFSDVLLPRIAAINPEIIGLSVLGEIPRH